MNESKRIEVHVDGLTFGGAFIGRVTDGPLQGKKAFIREVGPSELVTAEVTHEKKNFLEAALTQILKPHPERVTPPCPYYARCGGCDLQYLSLSVQREVKRRMVEDTLRFQAKMIPHDGVILIGSDLPGYHYRKRITLHLNERGEFGFYRPGSGEVVDIDACLISSNAINNALQKFKPTFQLLAKFVGAVVFEESAEEVFFLLKLREEVAIDEFLNVLTEKSFNGIEVKATQNEKVVYSSTNDATSIGHFSQVNAEGNALLVETVLREIRGHSKVTELYAGSGNFSLPLAQTGTHVTAVELDPKLVEFGKAEATRLGIEKKVHFIAKSAEQFVRESKFQEVLLLDPPRAGAKAAVEKCSPTTTKLIVYVSCNLPSFCRDLQILAPHYQLQRVYVVDMFAQTHHVEVIGVLSSLNFLPEAKPPEGK